LHYHPEVYLGALPIEPALRRRAESIVREKWKWIRHPKTPGSAAARHAAIQGANHDLQEFLEGLQHEAALGLEQSRQAERTRQIRESREYAFCLYPERDLKALFFSLG
jgi:hypothetical protein